MTDANTGPTLWGIHAGETGEAETLFLQHGYIALGWKAMGDIGTLPDDREKFKAKVREVYPTDPPMAQAMYAGELYRFVHEVKAGDYVAFRPKASVNGTAYVFLGRIAGPYIYNPFLDPRYHNVRRVEWLRSVPANRFSKDALKELSANLSLFQIDDHAAEFLDVIAESK